MSFIETLKEEIERLRAEQSKLTAKRDFAGGTERIILTDMILSVQKAKTSIKKAVAAYEQMKKIGEKTGK